METINKVLSIQSHVVSGYVGNKSASFPLQLLGFDVEAINSVQLSNHTGYSCIKGQVLNATELSDLRIGLKENNLLNHTHILTGYMGSASFLRGVAEIIRESRVNNPALIYVCDPVMGDLDQMYVPEELLPIYKDEIINLADILTPNQFETELLTSVKIENEEDAFKAIDILHEIGIPTVIITSTNLGTEDLLVGFASTIKGNKERLRFEMPKFPASFTGTGDLFTALLLAWMSKTNNNLKQACEKTINTMQAVLKRTYRHSLLSCGNGEKISPHQLELKLIQSKNDIESPRSEFRVKLVN